MDFFFHSYRLTWLPLFSAGAAVFVSSALHADSVATADSARLENVKVVSITDAELKFADGKAIPAKSLRNVSFDSFPVAPKGAGAVFADGSILGGVPRRKEKAAYVFRSTALGEFTAPEASLAGFYFDDSVLRRVVDSSASAPCVVGRRGEVTKGKILWVRQDSVGVMTESGPAKLDPAEVAAVWLSPVKPSPRRIVLRNGDVINFHCVFKGNEVEAKIGETRRSFPLEAVASARFGAVGK